MLNRRKKLIAKIDRQICQLYRKEVKAEHFKKRLTNDIYRIRWPIAVLLIPLAYFSVKHWKHNLLNFGRYALRFILLHAAAEFKNLR